MANCVYTLNGKKYSYDEFRAYLLENADSLGLDKEKLTGKSRPLEQLQKVKPNKDLSDFREKQLGRDLKQEEIDLKEIEKALSDKNLSEEERDELEEINDAIMEQQAADRQEYLQYTADIKNISDIAEAEDLSEFSLDDLLQAYNAAKDYDNYGDKTLFKKAKERIGYVLQQNQIELLEKKQPELFNKAGVNKKDLSTLDVWFKALADIGQMFPAVQGLSKAFNDKWMEMTQERAKLKAKHEALGKAVIVEYNKKHGIVKPIAQSLFSSDSAKYFEYLDNGKGQYISDTKGLSKAQIDYLNFMKELTAERAEMYDENDNLITDAV